MRRTGYILPLLASLCWCGWGCALNRHTGDASPVSYSAPAVFELAGEMLAGRGKITVDASALSPSANLERALGQSNREVRGYISLSAADAQCQAASNSSLANLIEMERQIGACTGRACLPRKPNCEAAMKDDLLALRAVDERNKAAGAALELYYRLAESEAGLDVLAQSRQSLDEAQADIAELKAEGLKIEADESILKRRQLELLDQQAETELGREQSHGGLKMLLGLADEDPTRIWPAADLKATVEPLDVEGAVAEGLANRAELIILRCLAESLSVQTLPGATAALQQRDASLGSSSLDLRKLHLLLAGTRGDAELPIRRAQIAQLLHERERTIIAEIRGHAATVAARLRQAAIANDLIAVRRQHLTELEKKRELGSATPFDIAAEKLEIIKAEGELMRKLIAWRIAQVKLKQSQGLLAAECGFQHVPCCGCGGSDCDTCYPLAARKGQAPTIVKATPSEKSIANSLPLIVEPGDYKRDTTLARRPTNAAANLDRR